jgi:ribosomal protein S12 methylthiotransferase accessory factor
MSVQDPAMADVSTLDRLLSPVGVISGLRRAAAPRGLDRLAVWLGSAGSGHPGHGCGDRSDVGSSRLLDDPGLARVVALAETAERYAGRNLAHRPVLASAAELGAPTLDMSRVARCSDAEYAHPDCPLRPYDPAAEIRWVPGTDLHTGATLQVPAVMASYGLAARPAERFWAQISTGTAVHTDPVRAVTGALLEVVERDLIAVLWLQRLAVPPLAARHLTDRVRYLVEWARRRFLDTYLFDATTDLGVPTVYVLQTAEFDERAHRVVGCGTGRTLGEAAEKALLELATLRPAFHNDEPVPDRPQDFTSVMHGARYLGRRERAAAFDFLLDGLDRRPVPEHDPRLPDEPGALLRHLLDLLRDRDMTAVVVEHPMREMAYAGLTAVTVLVPDLMPMSLRPFARFLGHPRLYDAPRRMGHPVLTEAEVNPWPQPFA